MKQPRLTGSAAANQTIELFNAANALIGSATVSSAGSYTISPSSPLADGTYVLHVAVMDVAGNLGPASGTLSLTIRTTIPATPAVPVLFATDDSGVKGDGITNITQPRITGTADANATIQLLDSLGNVLTSTTSLANGSYTITVPAPLGNGPAPFRVRELDFAGNLSASEPRR